MGNFWQVNIFSGVANQWPQCPTMSLCFIIGYSWIIKAEATRLLLFDLIWR